MLMSVRSKRGAEIAKTRHHLSRSPTPGLQCNATQACDQRWSACSCQLPERRFKKENPKILSVVFCMGRWQFGRMGWAARKDRWNIQMRSARWSFNLYYGLQIVTRNVLQGIRWSFGWLMGLSTALKPDMHLPILWICVIKKRALIQKICLEFNVF